MGSQSLVYHKEPTGFGSKLAGILQGVFVCFVMATTLALVNISQIVSLILFPISRRLFRRVNTTIASIWWETLTWLMMRIFRVRIVLTGDSLPQKENVLLTSNHQEMTDIPVLVPISVRQGCSDRLKWFAKYPVKFVPGPGWGMHFIGCVFLKRDWAKDQASVEATFANIKNNKIPAWLMLFPEGTRITPKKLAASQSFAKEKGLWQPDNVLIPRTKGFAAAVSGLHDYLDAVYDVTIGYPEGIASLWQFIRGVCREVHVHIVRYPMAEIPKDQAGLNAFVMRLFQEKDKRLSAFKRDKRFI